MGIAQEVRGLFQAEVAGSGVRVARYPVDAAGTKATGSGNTVGAYKWSAAGANVIALLAKATIGANFKIIGCALDTPSAASIFQARLGHGGAAAAAMTNILSYVHLEIATDAGGYVSMFFPLGACALVIANTTTDAILAEITSSNAGADDTALVSGLVATGIGT